MREVVVRTGARLHFGLFDLDPASDHQFSGVGMMIDSPGVTVRATLGSSAENGRTSHATNPSIQQRVQHFMRRLWEVYPGLPDCQVEVPQFIPSHHGLGSGTQLALAVGAAVSHLAGMTLTPGQIAVAAGRGLRSAVGVHGFERGGFIVDGGHNGADAIGTMQQRVTVPGEWRIVLVMPNDTDGLSGPAELQAFRDLPAMPIEVSGSLQEIVERQIVPAVQSADFTAFATSLHEFGQRIGRFFAPVQGGTYRSPIAANLADKLRMTGPQAIVQSSWGPTVALFSPNEEQAMSLAAKLPDDTDFIITRPLNTPARVEEVG